MNYVDIDLEDVLDPGDAWDGHTYPTADEDPDEWISSAFDPDHKDDICFGCCADRQDDETEAWLDEVNVGYPSGRVLTS